MVRNGQFLRDGKASHSPCIWMSAKLIHGVAFLSCWFTLKGVCCCCEVIRSKRKRVFEDDVFIENTRLVGGSKTQDLNLHADAVLNMSRGPLGQWFPETGRRIYRKYASCRWLKNAGLEFTRGRSFKHVTWSSWPMVSRDWILSVRHLCGNKWHTAENNL